MRAKLKVLINKIRLWERIFFRNLFSVLRPRKSATVLTHILNGEKKIYNKELGKYLQIKRNRGVCINLYLLFGIPIL